MDAVRFIAAFWVLLSHFGAMPVFGQTSENSLASVLLVGALNNLFCGSAAVIVFFVISGFCIHYPYAGNREFGCASFLIRRFVRICVPAICAVLFAIFVGYPINEFSGAVLWSLVAEAIYYAVYPLIRKLNKKISLRKLIVAAYCLAFLVILTEPGAGNFASYGQSLNWIVGLPSWLLGCKLAEDFHLAGIESSAPSSLGHLRLGIWGVSSLSSVLRFHVGVGYPWTLSLFALLSFTWLRREILNSVNRPRPGFLEWGGQWSYSLYLLHMPVQYVVDNYLTGVPEQAMILWISKVLLALLASYFFFLVCERPSHLLARWLATRWFFKIEARDAV